MSTVVLLGGQFGDEGKGQNYIPDPEHQLTISNGACKANSVTFSPPMPSYVAVPKVVTTLGTPYM